MLGHVLATEGTGVKKADSIPCPHGAAPLGRGGEGESNRACPTLDGDKAGGRGYSYKYGVREDLPMWGRSTIRMSFLR